VIVNVKSFPNRTTDRSAALISFSIALRLRGSAVRRQFTLRDYGYGACASRGVPLYELSLAVIVAFTHGGMAGLSYRGLFNITGCLHDPANVQH